MRQPGALRIGRRWLVTGPGAQGSPERLQLIVPRGAFGSGEHETTASCLEILEERASVAGARVLDLGSGTGILAVAALRLGAAAAVAVDVDPRAAVTTRRSARLNGVGDRLGIVLGPLDAVAQAPFELVLANLYGDLLLELAGGIVERLGPGAALILSGIAWEYAAAVRERFKALGCEQRSERWLEEFVSMHFVRKP